MLPRNLPRLRKGKWTLEEELYAGKIIACFNRGLLPIEVGTTLRSYLSDMLWCDPMRITKKFAGASCIGKQVFSKNDDVTQRDRELAEQELNALKDAFQHRLANRNARPSSLPRVMASHTAAPKHLPNHSHAQKASQAHQRQESVVGSETSSKKQIRESAERPRRVVSTPNLAKHQMQAGQLAYANGEMMNDRGGGVQQPSRMDMSPMDQHEKLKKVLKRSHSSVSMSEGDKLAHENDDTSDLFLQFVHKMSRDYYTRHAEATAAAQNAEQQLYEQNQYPHQQQQQLYLAQQPSQYVPDYEHEGDTHESRHDGMSRIDTQALEGDRGFKLVKLEASGSVASLSSDSTSNESVFESPVPQSLHASAASSLTSSCATSPVGLEMDCEEELSNHRVLYALPGPGGCNTLSSSQLDEKTRHMMAFNRDHARTAEIAQTYDTVLSLDHETSEDPDDYELKNNPDIETFGQPQLHRVGHVM